ncbi:MAG: WYL domain-containing protein [Deltaproteobacteria bacterium]|nr:WYL domain-containing protein [Kofleriaceae bacterium]
MRRSKGSTQIVRCLALLLEMARNDTGVALRAFAEKHGWNPRALYRDIDRLEEAGVPIQKLGDRFSVEAAWLPPGASGVTREELMALFVARSLAPGLRETRLGRMLDTMSAKLSAPGRQAVLDLDRKDWLNVRAFAPIDYARHRDAIETLERAIDGRHVVEIGYQRPDGEQTLRLIEPGYLHWDGAAEALYVPSWCRLRDDVRNFAVHRIQSARLTDDRFAPRPETRRTELARAFRLWYRKQVEPVRIWFAGEVAGEIRERRWHSTQRLTESPGGGVVLYMELTAPDELTRWLCGYGASVAVLEPARLAEKIRTIHAAAASIAPLAATDASVVTSRSRGPRRASREATAESHGLERRERR